MTDARRTASPTHPAMLELQSEVTAEDVERAKLAAQRDGSKLLNAMLNAKADEGEP
jgi:hypothetical protein